MVIKHLISQGFKITTYRKGDVVYSPGAIPRAVYFIKTGKVRMVTVNDEGREFIQGIFKANEYFGEPALLLSKPYLAFTIADQNAEIIVVPKSAFLELLVQLPDFNMLLIRNLSSRLFYKSMMLEEMANEQAQHRVVTLVNYLMKDLDPGSELKYTRQQLADMSGLRVETVIRIIKKISGSHSFELLNGKLVKV